MSDFSQEDTRKIHGVLEITRIIKNRLNQLGTVWIEGEISGLKSAPSGHTYFELKDDEARIPAALFRGSRARVPFEPRDGMKIRACGSIDVYEPRGAYQLIVRSMEEAGIGALQAAFEKLKERLKNEGLFDENRKKPLPLLPLRIGLVTSPSGAAIQDIFHVLNRRFPNLHIIVSPTRVQGEGSGSEIAEAIRLLDASGKVDVIIVGRGGGSLEDLWAFNEEVTARAIAESVTPIISAVGHEVDYTIADFVADVRAPTPSAAAEIVVGQKESFEQQLYQYSRTLSSAMKRKTLEARNRFVRASRSYAFREPQHLLQRYRERLTRLHHAQVRCTQQQHAGMTAELIHMRTSMAHAAQSAIRRQQQRMDEQVLKMKHSADRRTAGIQKDLHRIDQQLKALNPTRVLQRGYSMTKNDQGHVIQSATAVKPGDLLETVFKDGSVKSKAT